jgi:uncharacterized membrane protein YGL010W
VNLVEEITEAVSGCVLYEQRRPEQVDELDQALMGGLDIEP